MERKSNVFDRVLAALMIVVMLFSNGGAGLSVFAEELLDQVALEAQADASVEGELSDESRDLVVENTSSDGSDGSEVDPSQSEDSLTGEVSDGTSDAVTADGTTELTEGNEQNTEGTEASGDGSVSETREENSENLPVNSAGEDVLSNEKAIDMEQDSQDVEPNADSTENNGGEGEGSETNDEEVTYTLTFDPNTEEGGTLAPITIQVKEGEPIGDQLPDCPDVPGYRTKWVVISEDETKTVITSETVVLGEFTAVVDKEKIVYTVTFVQEDGTEVTRSTDIDAGFAINELPAVTPKTNQIGKWVYPGTTNEFTVGTVVSSDLTVNAYYEQNIFTVKFMVDDAQYEEMTTATGTTIVLPSDPVKAGATFKGWYTEPDGKGTQYTASSTVSSDLTLYAFFEGHVRVSFLVKDDAGNIISEKSQYFVDLNVGDQITTMPEDPFIAGKAFDYWKNENTGAKVEAGTTVTESFNAVAVFKSIDTYELTVNYFYMNGEDRVAVGTQVYDLVEGDFPYTVIAPSFTIASEITDEPTYYPSQATIIVEKSQFTKEEGSDKYTFIVEDEYVASDAEYVVGHYLKSLSGDGYELIETVDKVGVKNSKVTPEIKSYPFAQYENRDENVTITETSTPKQELKVYYTRRDFTLSFDVSGGNYIEAVTAKYGTEVTLPLSASRAGYTFDGWYKDSDYNEPVGTSITLEDNMTLHAKWVAAQVDYKIVYMVENANDADYSYLATVTKKAATGTTITMTAQTAGANGTRPSELDTTNFTFKDSTTETILADGTTVIVVRYSRNVYTLQGRSGTGWNASDISGATVTAKYGADITQAWTEHFNNRDGSWSYDNRNNSKFKSLTIMPSLEVREHGSGNTIYVFNHEDTADFYQHLEYWLQNYSGEGVVTTTYNGKTYGRVKSVDMRYNYLSDTDDWYDITGYTKAGYTATSSRTKNGTYSSFFI